MKAEEFIESIGRSPAIEELHQFIHDHRLNWASSSNRSWKRKARNLALMQRMDRKRSKIPEPVLEEMYRSYISSRRKPLLTYRTYSRIVRRIISQ